VMNIKKIIEWDKKNLERMKKIQLPNQYKSIGVVIAAVAFFVMIGMKFIDDEPTWIKEVLINGILVGFLLISISKEKVEDEMIATIRMQSYSLAFILGVLYSLIQPYINYGVELLIDPQDAATDMSYFQVLVFMLLIQLMFFHVMLKKCRS